MIMENLQELPIEHPFFDKKGNQIKEFDLIKFFILKGETREGTAKRIIICTNGLE